CPGISGRFSAVGGPESPPGIPTPGGAGPVGGGDAPQRNQRRASLESSLAEVGCEVVGFVSSRDNLLQQVQVQNPEVVIIDIESPSRDTLDGLTSVQSRAPRPIVMFTQDDNGETIARATRAGVSAYVVDGISQKRVRPILMTTSTTAFGLLPLVLFTASQDANIWNALALATIGGLLSSTLFVLVAIPVAYRCLVARSG
ncbi:MAG: efflux RND transporter permease subunit, partial [Gemmatimonadales bacterium]